MIKILHLITELDVGGAEQMLQKLVTHMDSGHFHNSVVSMTDRGVLGKKISSRGIRVFELGMSRGRPDPKGFFKFYRLLKKESPDIIQCWLYHADLLGLITGRAARIKKIAWGIRCSDMDFADYRFTTKTTVKLCAQLSSGLDGIVVNSEKGMEVHRQLGYFTEKMHLIPNGFDLTRFSPDNSAKGWLLNRLGLPRYTTLIGLVARYDPVKDHETFLKAAALLAETEKSAHFVLVGKEIGPENYKLRPLLGGPLKKRVHLLGYRQDIPRLTAAFDIASSASKGEGFSNTIGEAMACAIPCVATDAGDSARILGDTGIIIPPGDPKSLARAWRDVIARTPAERRTMGERARRRVAENFELGKVTRQFEAFYRHLLD
jgi:glycosyltransferase involved in cell wall biosynthesis